MLWGKHPKESYEKPSYSVNSPEQLIQFIDHKASFCMDVSFPDTDITRSVLVQATHEFPTFPLLQTPFT